MKTITNIIYPPFALLAFACFALSPQARATCQHGCDTSKGNTFLGEGALESNTTGNENTAIGGTALLNNTDGFNNTGIGFDALLFTNTGSNNTATGAHSLFSNLAGGSNTATGSSALVNNTDGSDNTAYGVSALAVNTTGNNNIALGNDAGINLTTGDNNIDIGNAGVAGESNTIRIGDPALQTATFVAGIRGVAIAGAQQVGVNANGQLGIRASSARFKDKIRPIGKESEAILALKPVTFHYKKDLDPEGIPQFGLVAEQVERVNPDLVDRDADGKPYTVRYEAVNAMLLNEFLKEHRKVERLEKQIEALTVGLQKVSAQLEASKPARQVVLNDR